jgi:hypothetical protein
MQEGIECSIEKEVQRERGFIASEIKEGAYLDDQKKKKDKKKSN